MSGCVETVPQQPSTAPVGNSLQKALAHNDSADSNVKLVKPHTDKTGQEIIDIVVSEHKQVRNNLNDASKELNKVNSDYKKIVDVDKAKDVKIAKLENSWGHKLQVWVDAAKTFLIAAAIIHVVMEGLYFAFPLSPYAWIFKLVGTLVNPFAWFAALFRWLASKRITTVTP